MNELIINASPGEVNIALIEDKHLVELQTEKEDKAFSVGDIYLGKVKKVVSGLNAAFVDIGSEKDAFLHYFDLGPQIRSLQKFTKAVLTPGLETDPLMANFTLEKDIDKGGKISQVISNNQWMLVQIAKEPISTKGPRISSELSLAGRYVVLVPFTDEIAISQKIKNPEERNRLRRLVQSIRPKNFGVIIRTVAESRTTAELDTDIQDLVSKWKSLCQQLKTAKPNQKVLGELNRTSTILRDVLNASFNNIHVNDGQLHEEIKNYIRTISPGQEDIVRHYKGKVPIFEFFGVDKQIKASFGKTVTLHSGVYLVVEHTEALHVIDVNSGHRMKADNSQETNALQVNLEAAKEVARQLRLRDMGGIIVVDFIDMYSAANRKTLFETLRGEMKKDRAKHNILPPSKFGLIQITRQRVRPETNISTSEKCPACDGTGQVKATVLVIDDMEYNINYFIKEQNEKSLSLHVHPFIEAYLNKGSLFSASISKKWNKTYKRKIAVKADSSYHFLEYHFFNGTGEEIKI